MSHYASTLPESVTYNEPMLAREPVLGTESESAFGQESAQESSQESVVCQDNSNESVLCYRGESCSKGCLCPAASQEEEPKSITIENEAGDKIVLKSYSTKSENRISINTVDMSFYEFKGYLADIGMVDDYDMLENKHWRDIKIISTFSACLGGLSVMALIAWFVLLVQGIIRLN